MKHLKYASLSVLLVSFIVQAQEQEAHAQSIWGDETSVDLGLGIGVAPRYLGAKDYHVSPLPTLSVHRGIFFIDSLRGLGVEYLAPSNTYLSAAVNYDPGRKDKNSNWAPGSDRLAGMGRVHGSTVGNLFVSQDIASWLSVNGEANFRLAGEKHRGNDYRFGLESKLFESDNDTLTAGLDTHIGDSKFNQTYFGVSRDQANRTRFKYHKMSSGMYAFSYRLDWVHKFDKHWSLFAGVNVMHFVGDAKRSPIVERDVGVTGAISLNYSF